MDDVLVPLQDGIRERYRIETEIGRGGMAIVYRAHDLKHDRCVAIKCLKPELTADLGSGRFQREIAIVARLAHPNILPLYDSGELPAAKSGEAPLRYYVMPYLEGESLRDRLRRDKQLPIDDAIAIAEAVADALGYAHSHGLIHRDIKPENILFQAGHALVSDFGIARAVNQTAGSAAEHFTATGMIVGTLAYMSPEQVAGNDNIDGRSDLYSLGCVLYEMLTGQRPPNFFGIEAKSPSGRERNARTIRPDVSPALASVIARSLARSPADRYPSAADFKAALEHARRSGEVALPSWITRPLAAVPDRWRHRLVPIAAIAFVIVVGATWYEWGSRAVSENPENLGMRATKLAVLPFTNLTGDTAQQYFSDGLTEDITTELGRLNPQRLAVIASSSAMRYKKTNKTTSQIGHELGVAYLVEGGTRQVGSHVRVTVQLVRVSDEVELWSDKFDRELSDVLAVQGAVAEGVARSLAVALLPAEQQRLANARPVNPAAYEAYLKGMDHATKLARADLETSLQYFQMALAKDSNYALAYDGMADVWSGMQQMGFMPAAKARPLLKAAAAKALELDPTLPRAHYRQAGINVWTDWDWAAGDKEFRKALALDPNDATGRAAYAHFLMIMKRPAEARVHMDRALELDPLNPQVRAFYATYLNFLGRYDDAIKQYQQVLATVPNMPMALNGTQNALFMLRRYDESLKMERLKWEARKANDVVAALDSGFAKSGYSGALQALADALAARSLASQTGTVNVAATYLRAGDVDRAIEWLERAYEQHDPNMPYIGVVPVYRPIRADARFQRILRRMRLPLQVD